MSTVISFGKIEGTVGLLAEQELRAALAICSGLTNKELAKAIGCAPGTVKKSVERVFYKLGVTSRSAVPTELFCRGIARHIAILFCAVLIGVQHQQPLNVRRPTSPRVEMRLTSNLQASAWAA